MLYTKTCAIGELDLNAVDDEFISRCSVTRNAFLICDYRNATGVKIRKICELSFKKTDFGTWQVANESWY
jgi:hypothetical protein